MDLSAYRGYFLDSIVVQAGSAVSAARISLTSEADDTAVIELFDVVHVAMDRPDGGGDFIDEAVVSDLPRTGAWPADAHHLLHLHNNDSELVWLRLIGPQEIEMVTRRLTTEHQSGARKRSPNRWLHGSIVCAPRPPAYGCLQWHLASYVSQGKRSGISAMADRGPRCTGTSSARACASDPR